MIRSRRLGLVAFAITGALAGCTLLIPFDEVRSNDAGSDALASNPDTGLAPDAGDAAAAEASRIDVYALGSCADAANGQYCGNNEIADYPYPDDLVTCDGGRIGFVKNCAFGVQCIHLPDPKPDQCDDCHDRSDGYYCGRELAGWSAANASVQVRCMNGSEVGLKVCAGTCVNGAASECP